MYFISDYFRNLIAKVGGVENFATIYGLSVKTISEWLNGTRKAQINSLIAVSAIVGLGADKWELLTA